MATCPPAALQTDRCAMAGQTNGAVVRRIMGDRRLEQLAAAAALARLYRPVRLLVNPFQPPFKPADKSWEGAREDAASSRPRARRLR